MPNIRASLAFFVYQWSLIGGRLVNMERRGLVNAAVGVNVCFFGGAVNWVWAIAGLIASLRVLLRCDIFGG